MSPPNFSIISTLVLLFLSALIGGYLVKLIRQPVFMGYIISGILIGNLFPSFIDKTNITRIGEIGITLLLFTIGLEFSFHKLANLFSHLVWTVAIQILVTTALVLSVLLFLGITFLPALYIAVASSLSSTSIVVRFLSERNEQETIPGEIMTGWLIIQDLSVILIMMILRAVSDLYLSGSIEPFNAFQAVFFNIGKAGVVIGIIIILSRKGIPLLFHTIMRFGDREMLLVTTIGLVLVSTMIFYVFGLTGAIGSFVAGLLVAQTSQNHAIFSEIRPLRDIFSVIFFVSLGMTLPFSIIIPAFPFIVGLSFLIMGIKFIIIYGLLRFCNYHRKTSFLASIGLMQISEFGFIIGLEGLARTVLSQTQYVHLAAIIFCTICFTVPLLSQGHALYFRMKQTIGKWIPRFFSETDEHELSINRNTLRNHVIICGYGRVGKYIARALEMARIPFLVIDFNQLTIQDLKKHGFPYIYGDPSDMTILALSAVEYARILIIAIPDRYTQEMIIGNAQTLNTHIRIVCRTHHEEDQKRLKILGVSTIIQPEFEASIAITSRLLSEFGVPDEEISGKISRLKIEHGLG